MFISQSNANDDSSDYKIVHAFLQNKIINLIINGRIQIGNIGEISLMQDIIRELIQIFILKKNNIEVMFTKNKIITNFKNYNFIAKVKESEVIHIEILIKWFSNINIKITSDNLYFGVFCFFKQLSKIKNSKFASLISELFITFISIYIRSPHLLKNLLKKIFLISGSFSNVKINNEVYEVSNQYDLTLYCISNVKHVSSLSILDENFTLHLAILTNKEDTFYIIEYYSKENNIKLCIKNISSF